MRMAVGRTTQIGTLSKSTEHENDESRSRLTNKREVCAKARRNADAEDVLATAMVVKIDVWYKLVIPCFAFPFMGEVARGRSEVQGRRKWSLCFRDATSGIISLWRAYMYTYIRARRGRCRHSISRVRRNP